MAGWARAVALPRHVRALLVQPGEGFVAEGVAEVSNAPTIIFSVPKPPSTNKLWRSVPGKKTRVLSSEYASWKTSAGWEAKRQLVGAVPIECRFDADISVPISRRDTDNWAKPLMDLCQHIGIVTNDGNMNRITVVPSERDDCSIALTPRPDLDGIRKKAKARHSYARPRAPKPSAAAVARGIRMGSLRP